MPINSCLTATLSPALMATHSTLCFPGCTPVHSALYLLLISLYFLWDFKLLEDGDVGALSSHLSALWALLSLMCSLESVDLFLFTLLGSQCASLIWRIPIILWILFSLFSSEHAIKPFHSRFHVSYLLFHIFHVFLSQSSIQKGGLMFSLHFTNANFL